MKEEKVCFTDGDSQFELVMLNGQLKDISILDTTQNKFISITEFLTKYVSDFDAIDSPIVNLDFQTLVDVTEKLISLY